MMRTTYLLLAFVGVTLFSFAEEKRIATSFIFEKSEDAPAVPENTGIFHFKFSGLEKPDLSAQITLSCDNGKNEIIKLNKGAFEYSATAGAHHFTIYINDNYFELYSHNLILGSQEKHYYEVRTQKTYGMQIEVDKPVIYLYPEESTEFSVTVAPKGEMAFTYPLYQEGWTGTMHPNGNIEVNGESFRYLFWESKQEMNALNPETTEGFVVDQKDIVSFLESNLKAVGFTSSERADFITFWGPQMQGKERVFVTFHQDTQCDRFAELNISPKPDNLHRFYMSWGEYNGNVIPEPQELSRFNRTGFTAIEWGGQEIPTITKTLSL